MLSDFGLKDPYVAEMKAVILSICPEARIVDVSHMVEKFNVRMGAFVLAAASPYFPEGTVHVGVVDPGVGTERRPIIVETSRSFYVGPDNGLLLLAARREHVKNVYCIENPEFMLSHMSWTFHGRDVFAPAAAHLARGVAPKEFGSQIFDYVAPDFAEPRLEDGQLVGEVLHVDGFGNVISNISGEELSCLGVRKGCRMVVGVGSKTVYVPFCSAYGEVPVGASLAVIGGTGFLELAVNQGCAAEVYGAEVGQVFSVALSVR